MTRHRRPTPTWPFLIVLLVLFVLSVQAPRGWERIARPDSWRVMLHRLASHPRVSTRPKTQLAPTQPIETPAQPVESTPQPRVAGPQLAIAPATGRVPTMIAAPAEPPRPEVTQTRQPAPASVAYLAAIAPRPQPAVELQFRTAPRPEAPVSPPAPVQLCWWPEPEELKEHLTRTARHEVCRNWALAVRVQVEGLMKVDGPRDPRAAFILDELEDLASEQNTLLPQIADPVAAADFRKAGLALVRRLDLWSQLPQLGEPAPAQLAEMADPARLAQCLVDVESQMQRVLPATATSSDAPTAENPSSAAPHWHRYLLLDALKELTQRGRSLEGRERQRLAARVLSRLERVGVNAEAQASAPHEPLAALHTELRRWAAKPVEPRELVMHLEQFERTGLPSHAQFVAEEHHRLSWASGEPEQQLAHALTTHYRNANLRVSITADLLNRIVRAQPPRDLYVSDSVLGRPTRGWTTTWTDVKFRLLPDQHRARMQVEASGVTASDTVTVASIVRLRSNAQSTFLAKKEVELGLAGLRTRPAQTTANSFPRLTSVDSSVDFVPVLGFLVHSVAEMQYDDNVPEARREARRKITRQVSTEMDRELAERINRVNESFQDRLLAPLEALDLTPELIEAQTTEQRMTMRLRFAGDNQLAGHGARPRAPSDSLASLQVHNSLLNNIGQQLHLEGRTLTLGELRAEISKHLGTGAALASADHDDLQFTFANENPLVFRCEEGRLEFNMALAELRLGRDAWRDFTVRVYYKPDLSSGEGRLERDGTVQLIGDRLGPKAQITLRSIFSKAFGPSKSLRLLPAAWADHPGLADVRITQFDIHDGWIGLAIAPREPVYQARR